MYHTVLIRKAYSHEPVHETGTYHIVEQAKLGQVCTNAETGQSLHCSHTQSIDVNIDEDLN